jgi:hypothetical protein
MDESDMSLTADQVVIRPPQCFGAQILPISSLGFPDEEPVPHCVREFGNAFIWWDEPSADGCSSRKGYPSSVAQ